MYLFFLQDKNFMIFCKNHHFPLIFAIFSKKIFFQTTKNRLKKGGCKQLFSFQIELALFVIFYGMTEQNSDYGSNRNRYH